MTLCDPRCFTESTTPPHEQLPVVFESTDDPSLNLTRTDLNCDKTGTCYDGQYNLIYNTQLFVPEITYIPI